MRAEELLEEIETLRERMVKYYMADDVENAVKVSQQLDRKIYDYLVLTKGRAQ